MQIGYDVVITLEDGTEGVFVPGGGPAQQVDVGGFNRV